MGSSPVMVAPSGGNNNNIQRLDYTVDNMDCQGCVYSVEGIISSQLGVVSAKVTKFDFGEVEVYVNKDWIADYNESTFEKSLNDVLMSNGYELHPRGWKTQKMKFDESFASPK